MREIDNERQENRWMKQRREYYERTGWSTAEIRRRTEIGENMIEELVDRDRQLQLQEQYTRIHNSTYNRDYRHRMTYTLPYYLTQESNNRTDNIYTTAKRRCQGVKYWQN